MPKIKTSIAILIDCNAWFALIRRIKKTTLRKMKKIKYKNSRKTIDIFLSNDKIIQ